jgi:hypothetical protein
LQQRESGGVGARGGCGGTWRRTLPSSATRPSSWLRASSSSLPPPPPPPRMRRIQNGKARMLRRRACGRAGGRRRAARAQALARTSSCALPLIVGGPHQHAPHTQSCTSGSPSGAGPGWVGPGWDGPGWAVPYEALLVAVLSLQRLLPPHRRLRLRLGPRLPARARWGWASKGEGFEGQMMFP